MKGKEKGNKSKVYCIKSLALGRGSTMNNFEKGETYITIDGYYGGIGIGLGHTDNNLNENYVFVMFHSCSGINFARNKNDKFPTLSDYFLTKEQYRKNKIEKILNK